MHAAIEHEPLPCGFEVITIGANLSAPGEIDEFQPGEDERFRLTRATANFYRHPERSRGTPWRPRSTCGRGPWTSLGMTANYSNCSKIRIQFPNRILLISESS